MSILASEGVSYLHHQTGYRHLYRARSCAPTQPRGLNDQLMAAMIRQTDPGFL